MKHFLLIAAATAALSAPAFAGSAVYEAPVEVVVAAPVVVPAPGIDWTGAYLGADLGSAQFGGDLGDGTGTIGGIFGGYNYDFGSVVLGGELNYDMGAIEFADAPFTIDSMTRLTGKVGYEIGQVLVYGTGGWAMADADADGTSLNGTGYVYGAGVDYKFSDNIIVGADYLWHQFDDFDDTGVNIDGQTLRARVSYSF